MYDKKWYEGKSSDELKLALSERHGIPLWRIEEIIDVFTCAEFDKEMDNLMS